MPAAWLRATLQKSDTGFHNSKSGTALGYLAAL
jgi:hypothetical protein